MVRYSLGQNFGSDVQSGATDPSPRPTAEFRERLPVLRHSAPIVRIAGESGMDYSLAGDSEDHVAPGRPFCRSIPNAESPPTPVSTPWRIWPRVYVMAVTPNTSTIQGDFGLTPPARPRADKSKCDWGRDRRAGGRVAPAARRHSARGWSVNSGAGGILKTSGRSRTTATRWKAQLENSGSGAYHGYPMPGTDPFRGRRP